MSSVKTSYKALLSAVVSCFMLALAGCVTNAPAVTGAATLTDAAKVPQTTPGTEDETAAESETTPALTEKNIDPEETQVEKTLRLYIDGREMPVIWQDNDSVSALKELAENGLTVGMSMYGGFEQVGPLGKALPENDRQTTTKSGDIVLYSGNQIVIFYGSNSWSYTRLGHIDLSETEMTKLLSNGNVTVTLTVND